MRFDNDKEEAYIFGVLSSYDEAKRTIDINNKGKIATIPIFDDCIWFQLVKLIKNEKEPLVIIFGRFINGEFIVNRIRRLQKEKYRRY